MTTQINAKSLSLLLALAGMFGCAQAPNELADELNPELMDIEVNRASEPVGDVAMLRPSDLEADLFSDMPEIPELDFEPDFEVPEDSSEDESLFDTADEPTEKNPAPVEEEAIQDLLLKELADSEPCPIQGELLGSFAYGDGMDGAVIYGMGFGIDGMSGGLKGETQGANGNGIFKGEYKSPDIGTGQLGGEYQSVESDELGIFVESQ